MGLIMKNTITFNRFNVGVHIENGKPYLCANDMAKAWGYKASVPVKPHDKPIKVGSKNYVPIERVKQLVERTTGVRRPLAQDFLIDVEREFINSIPVQQTPIVPASLDTPYEVRAKQLQIEKEVMSQRAELLAVEMQILTHEVHKRDLQLKLLEREAELTTIRPSNVLELKVASNG